MVETTNTPGGAGVKEQIPVLTIEKNIGVVKIYPDAKRPDSPLILEVNGEKTRVDRIIEKDGKFYIKFSDKIFGKYATMTMTEEEIDKIVRMEREGREIAERMKEEEKRKEIEAVYKRAVDTGVVYVRDYLNGSFTCYALCKYLHNDRYKSYDGCYVCNRAIRKAMSEHSDAFQKEVEDGKVFYKAPTHILLYYIKAEEEAEEAERAREKEKEKEEKERIVKEILQVKPTDLTCYNKVLTKDERAEIARVIAKETGQEVVIWRYGEETPRGWVNTVGVILPNGKEEVRKVHCH